MRVIQINAVCGKGSTGKICVSISKVQKKSNIENYILYSSGTSDYALGISYSNDKYIKLQALKSRILGNYGFNSNLASKRLISYLDKIKPDIVHLHNIHGHDFNLETVFKYFKEKDIKLIWTFHDCWAFTGYCTYFTFVQCDKWKTECNHCPQRRQYSWFFDKSKYLYHKKRELFLGLDLTMITPSMWLANLVKTSFLKEYPVHVINNGIDNAIFKPTPSDFRTKYSLEDKYIVLGVALGWGKRKGLDVFIELAKRLDARYQIVLVGTDEKVEKALPDSIISIRRTNSQQELAAIYTAADVFANPTREENFPTVNIEAISCGTPVVTFRTGGSPEMLDETCGRVVDCDDVAAMKSEIVNICESKVLTEADCMTRAKQFTADSKFLEYIELYRGMGEKAV